MAKKIGSPGIVKVLNILFLLTLLPWIIFALTSFFFFDDPSAGILAEILFFVVWIYPVVVLGSVFISRAKIKKKDYNKAILISLSPVLIILLIFLPLIFFQNYETNKLLKEYTPGPEDFLCKDGSFLRVEENRINSLVKEDSLYSKRFIGEINENEITLNSWISNNETIARNKDYLSSCLNSNNKTLSKEYRIIN